MVIVTLDDVVGWLVEGFSKKGALHLGLFFSVAPRTGAFIYKMTYDTDTYILHRSWGTPFAKCGARPGLPQLHTIITVY